MSNIPASATYALLTGIVTTNLTPAINFSFNQTNLPALQAYLNGLGLGTFVVVNSGGGVVTVTSANNTNGIISVTYSVASTPYTASQASVCDGYAPITTQEAVQNLVNYLCGIDDTQIKTSQAYEVCYIVPETGESATETVAAGAELTALLASLVERGCQTVEYIQSISTVDCETMQTVFPNTETALQSNATILAFNNGECTRATLGELFLKMLTDGVFNNSIIDAFCIMVNKCRGELACTAYSDYAASIVEYSETCPGIVSFSITLDESPVPVYVINVLFGNEYSTNQAIRIEYMQTSPVETVWLELLDPLTILVSGTNVGQADVDEMAGLNGIYNFRISNNCESPASYVYLYQVPMTSII